jgi:Na+-translocating ferredoxin:NAD+ oxidoreductase RnfG subunit
MNNYKTISAMFLTLSLSSTAVLAAENGITKEDIKHMQATAYSEAMQQEMEKSIHSELQTNIKAADYEIQADVASNAADDQSIRVRPALSSR